MPKMKTHKGTAKRVKVTGRGKLMVRPANPKRLKRRRSRMYGLRRNRQAHESTRKALRRNLGLATPETSEPQD